MPKVKIFESANYEGRMQELGPGRYHGDALTVTDNAVSSVMVPDGWKATLWSDPLPGYAALGSEEQWPPGQPIRVYHHPNQPERAVLDPRVSTTRKVMTVLATALSGFGVLAAFVGRPRAS